jgi:serine protease AprX
VRRVGLALTAAILGAMLPVLASGGSSAAAQPSAARDLHLVLTVQPGTPLPSTLPAGRVLTTFPRVGAELVAVPASAVDALRADPAVAGLSPDWRGRVTGIGAYRHNPHVHADAWHGPHGHKEFGGGSNDGESAPRSVGGDAGAPWVGAGVTVALLDTGVNDTAALNRASGRLVDGIDLSHISSGGVPVTKGPFTDGYGHGTFLASLIAGGPVAGTDGLGVGIAPAAHVVVVKVAGADGQTSLLQVLAGLNWVAAHSSSIQIVNLSLAVTRPTSPAYGADPLNAAVEDVRADGVLVVAAAGNTPGEVGDPGMDPTALTVGAAQFHGDFAQVAPFSGSGVVDGVAKPDIVAAGAHVLGVMSPQTQIARTNPQGWTRDGLFLGSGTSEATAIASGVAAAYLSAHPGSTPLQIKSGLRTSARPLCSPAAGAGLVTLAGADADSHGCGGWRHRSAVLTDPTGEATFDAAAWQAAAWLNGAWEPWLAAAWSASSWSASSWSASSWSASSWSASSWSASSWSASSWSASSWSASSWSDLSWGSSG